MIKNILLIILALLVVWLSKDYFSITLPTYPLPSSTPATTEIKEHVPKHKDTQPLKIEKADHLKEQKQEKKVVFNELVHILQADKFYDALSFYLENSTVTNQKLLEAYLHTLANSQPSKALEYMQVYLDEVPQSAIQKLLVTTYIQTKQYDKAIEKIMETKENYVSESEDKRLAKELKETSIKYIEILSTEKEYTKLIAFLENMIAYDESDSFYSFRLAQLYMELDKTIEAAPLLDGLQYDEVYAQKAKSYIQTLDLEPEENSYEYAIPLSKYGSHYVVNVTLDGTDFRLMLDTGASYIYLDRQKASMLQIINPNLRLQTAGGDVTAELRKASSMRVGDLELSDMEVTTAPFQREGIDGLLGMNFLNKFAFYIDQKTNILYLNNK